MDDVQYAWSNIPQYTLSGWQRATLLLIVISYIKSLLSSFLYTGRFFLVQ